jgi:hypothetical protein
MKKFLLSIVFVCFASTIFCQTEKHIEYTKNYYLKKANNKRTVAWSLLGGGLACFAGGGIIALNRNGVYGKTSFWDYLSAAGLIAIPTSIFFFARASHYKSLARRTVFIINKVPIIMANNLTYTKYPQIGVRIIFE